MLIIVINIMIGKQVTIERGKGLNEPVGNFFIYTEISPNVTPFIFYVKIYSLSLFFVLKSYTQ